MWNVECGYEVNPALMRGCPQADRPNAELGLALTFHKYFLKTYTSEGYKWRFSR